MSRFRATISEFKLPQCNNCIHYQGSGYCEAFLAKIPDEIFNNFHDHKKPYPGDNGIQFEEKNDE